jgi:hypothetical protein
MATSSDKNKNPIVSLACTLERESDLPLEIDAALSGKVAKAGTVPAMWIAGDTVLLQPSTLALCLPAKEGPAATLKRREKCSQKDDDKEDRVQRKFEPPRSGGVDNDHEGRADQCRDQDNR